MLDDEWFGARRNDHAGLGDWTVSTEVWPHGLHPLVDKVTGLGMEFGLWFEPEMINLDSAIARTHPDWIMSTPVAAPRRVPPSAGDQLGAAGVLCYIRNAMFDILAEYKISYIKWDHNRDLIDAGSAPDGPGSTSRPWPSTDSLTRSKPRIRDWRLRPAPLVAPGLILAC